MPCNWRLQSQGRLGVNVTIVSKIFVDVVASTEVFISSCCFVMHIGMPLGRLNPNIQGQGHFALRFISLNALILSTYQQPPFSFSRGRSPNPRNSSRASRTIAMYGQLDSSLIQLSFLSLSRAPQGVYQAYQAHSRMMFEVRYIILT